MRYNISKILKKGMWGLLALTAFTACTDTWDDHYNGTGATNGKGSMWETITANPELSDFSSLVSRLGYSDMLSGSQVFTVFAPTNEAFAKAGVNVNDLVEEYYKEKAAGVKDKKNTVLKEYVFNHIARYKFSVSDANPDTASIMMMNGKFLNLSSGAFAGNDFLTCNTLTGNGILYTMDQIARYQPNLYEQLGKDENLDSIRNFVYKKSYEEFSASESVPGEVIDGKQHYKDSVTYLRNELFSAYTASRNGSKYVGIGDFSDEDSTFYMLAPNNDVWKKLLKRYENFFVYDEGMDKALRDSLSYNYPRYHIIRGTLMSVNPINKALMAYEAAGGRGRVDSVMSKNAIPYSDRYEYYGSNDKKYYQYDKPFEPGGIFEGIEPVQCSNGKMFVASKWNVPEERTLIREIVMEGENSLDSVYSNCTRLASSIEVKPDNPFYKEVSHHRYLPISPTASLVPRALFQIEDVLSNVPYDVYVYFAPAEAGDTLVAEAQRKPTKFRVAMQCNDTDGSAIYIKPDVFYKPGVTTKKVADVPAQRADKIVEVPSAAMFANPQGTTTGNFETKAGEVHECFIGTFTFPTCSYKTKETLVKLYFHNRVSSTEVRNGTHTMTMNIDRIVFKPRLADIPVVEE